MHNKVDRFISKFFTLLLAQVKYIVYLWGINFSAVFIFIAEIKKYYIMKYSILDLKNDFNIEENTVDVYFQGELPTHARGDGLGFGLLRVRQQCWSYFLSTLEIDRPSRYYF